MVSVLSIVVVHIKVNKKVIKHQKTEDMFFILDFQAEILEFILGKSPSMSTGSLYVSRKCLTATARNILNETFLGLTFSSSIRTPFPKPPVEIVKVLSLNCIRINKQTVI